MNQFIFGNFILHKFYLIIVPLKNYKEIPEKEGKGDRVKVKE